MNRNLVRVYWMFVVTVRTIFETLARQFEEKLSLRKLFPQIMNIPYIVEFNRD